MDFLGDRKNVYSQLGEDGIIEAILSRLPSTDGWCVEFGAWDGIYLSNTRNLIENKNYRAVLIEADKFSFKHLTENLKDKPGVVAINAFVGFSGANTLDALLAKTECTRNFDLLSIDVDGNDIHIWRATKLYRPKVVCIEYNPTIPTEVDFEQPANAKVKWGCSLAALVRLGKEKGYELVCANELNAFFVLSEIFAGLGVADNAPAALRPYDAPRTFVFGGYDGTVLLSGDLVFKWHGGDFSVKDIQPLPRILRKYPLDYTRWQRIGFRLYMGLRAVRSRLRSGAHKVAVGVLHMSGINRSL
jgi:hypothetical protein